MAVFNPTQTSALQSLVSVAPYLGQAQAEVLTMLNTPSVIANPTPQPTITTPFTVAQAFGLLSEASVGNLDNVGYVPDIRDQISANNVLRCLEYVAILGAGAKITPTEATALTTMITATEPDPTWPATIAGPTPFQDLFPGVWFTDTDGTKHMGNLTATMLAEVIS